jgi:glycosyltransferase involved in cell wall biosynthesis
MPLAVRIHKGAPILLDAREYYPGIFEDRFVWRLFSKPLINYLCDQYLRIPDSIITVSEGIALEYEKEFQVKPEVVMSLPDFIDLAPSPTDPQKIRMIYHGNATPSRRLEGMIEMMDDVDSRFFLDLMLVGNSRDPYLKKLQKLAGFRPNVRIIPPVTLQELVQFTNAYDIGLYLLPPTNFNVQHALPNKFFEFIQARLMVAIGPSVEMFKIVKEFDCGIVANDFNPHSLAQDLNRLDAPRIDYYKRQADLAARSLNSEESNQKIIEIVQNLI